MPELPEPTTFDNLRIIIRSYYPNPPPFNPAIGVASALSSGNFGCASSIISKSLSSGLDSLNTSMGNIDINMGYNSSSSDSGGDNLNNKDSYYSNSNNGKKSTGLTLEDIQRMTPEERRRAFYSYSNLYDLSLFNGFLDRPTYIYIKDITSRLFEVYD